MLKAQPIKPFEAEKYLNLLGIAQNTIIGCDTEFNTTLKNIGYTPTNYLKENTKYRWAGSHNICDKMHGIKNVFYVYFEEWRKENKKSWTELKTQRKTLELGQIILNCWLKALKHIGTETQYKVIFLEVPQINLEVTHKEEIQIRLEEPIKVLN